jgi:hypothetical protein
MELGVCSDVQLYIHGRCHSVVIRFPRLIFISVLTTRAI